MADDDTPGRGQSNRLGDFLPISRGAVRGALLKQSDAGRSPEGSSRIGDLLKDSGAVTEDELNAAIRKQRMARLAACQLFADLQPMELSAISAKFREVSVNAGEQFITQDAEEPTLYVMAAGQLEVFRVTEGGREIHIAEVGPGEPIGEMGYFQGGKRTASVRAILPSELLCAAYEDLTHYFENVPRVAHAFVEVVERRRRELAQKVEESETG